MPATDYNYAIALNAGAKALAGGTLRKAEEHFRVAVKRCPECPGGYRGLAKVYVELEDPPAAVAALRDGAQTLARTGNRSEAIELLRDATRLAPDDLAAHRRLAAALANAGDDAAAVEEYARFIDVLVHLGDRERALLEVAYGRELLGRKPRLEAVAAQINAGVLVPANAPSRAAARPPDSELAAAPSIAGAPGAPPPQPLPTDPLGRALALEERAQVLIASRDAAAVASALEAASALRDAGLRTAATDLLLQLTVAGGDAARAAQRVLIDLLRESGRVDLMRDKCALLAQALRLDGRTDLAAEVERLAAV